MITIKKLGEGIWWKNGTFWIILSPFIALDIYPLMLLYLDYYTLNTHMTVNDYYEFGLSFTIVVGGGFLLLLLLGKLKQRRNKND